MPRSEAKKLNNKYNLSMLFTQEFLSARGKTEIKAIFKKYIGA